MKSHLILFLIIPYYYKFDERDGNNWKMKLCLGLEENWKQLEQQDEVVYIEQNWTQLVSYDEKKQLDISE